MDFLLIRAGKRMGGSYFLNDESFYPPLGLEYIGASLEHDGHTVKIIDFCMEKMSRDSLSKYLKSADAVGISTSTYILEHVVNVADMIKEIDSEIPLIIGGPHCTYNQNNSLTDVHSADICVAGDGEKVIIDIVRFLEGKKPLSDIPGIYYREDNQIKAGKPIEIVDDLDSLYFPARHLLDRYHYEEMDKLQLLKPKFTTMITSRGCPFKCRFCARYGIVMKDYTYRKRSAENVVKEIQEIDEKYRSLMIVDDNFLEDEKRAHRIMDELIKIGTSVELFILGARVTAAKKDLYEKMKRANVKFVGYGLESGNQDVLNFYNKNITLDQVKKAVRLSRKMGFMTYGSFIIGAPIETKKHINKTIKFACSLPLDVAVFLPLAYQRYSQLWMEAVRNGKISENEYMVVADSQRGLGNFTLEELVNYQKKAFRCFYWRPHYLVSEAYRLLSQKNVRLVMQGFRVLASFKKIEYT